MACRKARMRARRLLAQQTEEVQSVKETMAVEVKKDIKEKKALPVERLLFGIDSKFKADDILQNNLTHFEWVVRNKVYPAFVGRNIVGENKLTVEEIDFLHNKGCKIAAIYNAEGEKETKEQGKLAAEKAEAAAFDLDIPEGTAIFCEVGNEDVSRDFMLGFAKGLLSKGYTPGFKGNTDAMVDFDHQFSMGMQSNKDIFERCLVWAEAPSLKEYDRVTTTHLIHPDNWKPYAPSGMTRRDIAVWQYGKECHPIEDDNGIETSFNVNLVRDEKVIINKMF